jgi:hypothetical protein
MSVAAAHAVKPPAFTPAAPVQRKVEPSLDRDETPRRLLTSLSAVPGVQRACAGCSGKDNEPEAPVMPKLEVGPVDDPYEREADDIAGRVMAMREPDKVQHAALDDEEPLAMARRFPVQRKCATCDDEEMPRMRADNTTGTKHIAASSPQLTSGGNALSPHTRNFFEGRMGRDLRDVRIHRGAASEALNGSIASRAFTFRNHIWLGGMENEGPSFTMAHELAHVLQQTQPGPARLSRGSVAATQELVRRAPELKFSGNAYWTSASLEAKKKNSGSQIHEDVLGQFQKTHPHLLIEAPIPKALPSKSGRSRSGEADLYIGKDKNNVDRTIGINFRQPGEPAKMTSTTSQPFHSSSYNHQASARPTLRGKSTILGMDEAPVSISLGELKPDKVKKGKTQLNTYENGIKRTQKYTNAFLADQNKRLRTSDPDWPDIKFSRIGVKPPNLASVSGTSFGKHKLHVYQFSGFKDDTDWAIGNIIHEPPVAVMGELKVKKHTDGIYYYWWEPVVKATSTSLPPQLASQAVLTDKLFTALRTNRKIVLPKRISARRNGPALVKSRVMRRKSGNAKKFPNHFDANKWLPNRKRVATAYGNFARNQDGAKGPAALTDWYLIEINKDLDSGDRQNLSQKLRPGGKTYKRTRQLRKMHILAQPFAPTMANLRRMFGGVFARASALYEKIKSRFESRSRPKKSISGGGILGALMKASFKVLLLIGRQIVASTMIQLTEQLKGCMSKMFETYFSIDDEVENIQARIDGVKGDLEAKVNAFIGGDVETLADTLFGPYGEQVDKVRSFIETITDIAGPILTAYKAVRWGIQALACASPPLLGCLWGLATSAIEWAAAQLIDTCWFMKKVAPKILKVQQIRSFMQSTSLTLSNGIIDAGSSLFPEPVGSFLKHSCKTDTPKVGMPQPSSICEEGGGSGGMSNEPKPSQEALDFWQRWEKLPFAKQMALKKMLGVTSAQSSAKVDWDKMNKMLDWANSRNLADMESIVAKAAAGDSSAIPGAVARVKQAAEAYEAGGEKNKKNDGGNDGDGNTGADSNTAGDGPESSHQTKNDIPNPAEGLSNGHIYFSEDPAKLTAEHELSARLSMATTWEDGRTISYIARNVPIVFVSYDAASLPAKVKFYIKAPKGETHYGITTQQTDSQINLAAGPSATRNYEYRGKQ